MTNTARDPEQFADMSESQKFWDPHYQRHIRSWNGNANAVLTDFALGLPLGSALDIGCAEGGDALWLAGLGWMVTAVDVSPTAIQRARIEATKRNLTDNVQFKHHDLTQSFPQGTYDLVSAQYFHSPVDIDRSAILRRAAAAVAPQGVLLVVDHASVAPWSWNQDPDITFPTPQETLATVRLETGQWQPIRIEAASRIATGPTGETATVIDNILALRRVIDKSQIPAT